VSAKLKISDFTGKDISGFKVITAIEVYKTNEDGRRAASVGFFKSYDVAVSFIGVQVDSSFYKTEQVFLLTNGTVGFVIDYHREVKLFDDEEEKIKIRKQVISKLSKSERAILGFAE
jgi:hypothetical protein